MLYMIIDYKNYFKWFLILVSEGIDKGMVVMYIMGFIYIDKVVK